MIKIMGKNLTDEFEFLVFQNAEFLDDIIKSENEKL